MLIGWPDYENVVAVTGFDDDAVLGVVVVAVAVVAVVAVAAVAIAAVVDLMMPLLLLL